MQLLRTAGGKVDQALFVIDLPDLGGAARLRGEGADVIVLTLVRGKTLALGVADDVAAGAQHRVQADGQTYEWTGPYARFDR